jgi:hypothetical protein
MSIATAQGERLSLDYRITLAPGYPFDAGGGLLPSVFQEACP